MTVPKAAKVSWRSFSEVVRLHRLATAAHDQALQHLCAELTATDTIYPGTDLRLIFEPIGATPLP